MKQKATNKLERAIMDAAKSAQQFHIKMTYGNYLGFSHESFLQNFIAMKLFDETQCCVYVDPSKRKIRYWTGNVGRPPLDMQNRFDIVVWQKTQDTKVKAVIEIKQAWRKAPILMDLSKVANFLKSGGGKGALGYVLYYSDKALNKNKKGKDLDTIRNRFKTIEKTWKSSVKNASSVELKDEYVFAEEGNDPWGFALYRVK